MRIAGWTSLAMAHGAEKLMGDVVSSKSMTVTGCASSRSRGTATGVDCRHAAGFTRRRRRWCAALVGTIAEIDSDPRTTLRSRRILTDANAEDQEGVGGVSGALTNGNTITSIVNDKSMPSWTSVSRSWPPNRSSSGSIVWRWSSGACCCRRSLRTSSETQGWAWATLRACALQPTSRSGRSLA